MVQNEVVMVQLRYYLGMCLEGLTETYNAYVLAEIQTLYLPNKNLELVPISGDCD
jgi:hypothetical protein